MDDLRATLAALQVEARAFDFERQRTRTQICILQTQHARLLRGLAAVNRGAAAAAAGGKTTTLGGPVRPSVANPEVVPLLASLRAVARSNAAAREGLLASGARTTALLINLFEFKTGLATDITPFDLQATLKDDPSTTATITALAGASNTGVGGRAVRVATAAAAAAAARSGGNSGGNSGGKIAACGGVGGDGGGEGGITAGMSASSSSSKAETDAWRSTLSGKSTPMVHAQRDR